MIQVSARRLRCFYLAGSFALIGAWIAGCGPASEPMLPVEGKIQFDGKALTKGTIILHPDASKNNHSKHEPRGVIDGEGRFKVHTHPKEGAPPGWYKVAVVVTEPSDKSNPYSVPRSLIPEKFGNAEDSKLNLEVRKDAPPGAYDLLLK